MSNPYGPNQQPVNGDNNGQHSAEQQPTEQLPAVNYSQQATQQMPAVNYSQQMPAVNYSQQTTQQMPAVNYSQQTTQQMPAAGGYGQAQPGYAQQQGYYPPGQFPASPYGGQPKKKGPNTGLIIGVIAAVIVGCLAVPLLLAQPVLRFHADALLLRVPVLGTFLRLAAWQMILRTVAILLRSGIRLDRAAALARAMTGNRALADQLGRMERNLVEGRTFAQVIAYAPYVPQILRGMLAAGEAAGELDRLLQHGADYCRRRAAAYSARMEALTEPVMVVLVAALIFFVVLSVLLPIFDTMDALM